MFNKKSFSLKDLVSSFSWMNEKLAKEQIAFWLEQGYISFKKEKYEYLKCNSVSLVFLDIDGVLNHTKSNDVIDEKCLNNFATIIKETNALVILTSSWKAGWNKNKTKQFDDDANYLDERLGKVGISIFDKSSRYAYDRCVSVRDWCMRFCTNSFIVLDDDWQQYLDTDLEGHLIRTDYYNGGLTTELAQIAITLLK